MKLKSIFIDQISHKFSIGQQCNSVQNISFLTNGRPIYDPHSIFDVHTLLYPYCVLCCIYIWDALIDWLICWTKLSQNLWIYMKFTQFQFLKF